MAKKSKAEEIIELKNRLQEGNRAISDLREEVMGNREVIERFNREKVGMLRVNTAREDQLKKIEE